MGLLVISPRRANFNVFGNVRFVLKGSTRGLKKIQGGKICLSEFRKGKVQMLFDFFSFSWSS